MICLRCGHEWSQGKIPLKGNLNCPSCANPISKDGRFLKDGRVTEALADTMAQHDEDYTRAIEEIEQMQEANLDV